MQSAKVWQRLFAEVKRCRTIFRGCFFEDGGKAGWKIGYLRESGRVGVSLTSIKI
jgi:hypothetical protein